MECVRTILFRSELRPSGTLDLVQEEDRSLLILRDDRPLAGKRWPHQQLSRAVNEFTALVRALRRG